MSIRRRYIHLGLVLLLALVAVPALHAAVAVAAPGDLDPTFGADGVAFASLGNGLDKATAMAVQPDGKYLVAGIHTDATTFAKTCTIVRFLSDGTLDPVFGSSWGTGVYSPDVARNWEVSQVLVDAEGRIYLFSSYRILRLLQDGQIDISFGSAGTADVSQISTLGPAGCPSLCMALCPDGGLIIGGGTSDPIHQGDIAAVRLLADGSLDTSFAVGGLFRMDVANGSSDGFWGIAIAGNGDILLCGVVQLSDAVLMRLTPSGGLSSGFGSGGLVRLARIAYRGVVVELPSHDLVVGNGTDWLMRLSATGLPDPLFGTNGTLTLASPPNSIMTSMVVLPDGGIVRAGTIDSGYPAYNDILVTRNLADGSVDLGFGSNGTVVTSLGGADDCAAAALDPSGKLVVAGYSYPSGASAASRTVSGGAHAATTLGMGLIRYLCGPSAPVVPVTPVKPVLTRFSTPSGKRGMTVTLIGKNFGARRTTSYVKFGTAKVGKYVSWSKTRIKCRVPAKAKFGRVKVVVVTSRGTSNAKRFTVKR